MTLDNTKLNELQTFLNNKGSVNVLAIPVSYMQVGISYTYRVTVTCVNSGYSCNSVFDDHNVKYDFSDIVCQIKGGSKTFSLQQSQLNSYSLTFDGSTKTYDPDASGGISDQSQLNFIWTCFTNSGTVDCTNNMFANPS